MMRRVQELETSLKEYFRKAPKKHRSLALNGQEWLEVRH
jgi:hypothetical protein